MIINIILMLAILMALTKPKTKSKIEYYVGIERQSSSGQSTLEEQDDWIKRILKNHNWKKAELISDTCNGSIFPIRYRKRIIKAAKSKNVKYIILFRVDRLGRIAAECIKLLDDLNRINKIKIISSEGNFDYDNPNDKFSVRLKLLLAEQETSQKNSRVELKIGYMLKNGIYPRKNPPFGYKKDANDFLHQKPWCKEVINKIFEYFSNNKDYSKTARKINIEFEEILHKKLNGQDIKKILSNKIYIGYLEWGGIIYGKGDTNEPHKQLAVISKDQFQKVQNLIKKISEIYRRSSSLPQEELAEDYGINNVVEVKYYRPPCPECNSFEYQENGSDKVANYNQKKYKCKKCKKEFRSPPYRIIKKIHDLASELCINCGVKNNFTFINEDSYIWKLICNNCDYVRFFCEFKDISVEEKKEKKPVHKKKEKHKAQTTL